MSQNAAVPPVSPVQPQLGIFDALGMGWNLAMKDFWAYWVVWLIYGLIALGIGLVSLIPFLGHCVSLANSVFVAPALMAGFIFVLCRKIDVGPIDIDNLFEGFRQRYWQSVVANLLILVSILPILAVMGVAFFVTVFPQIHRLSTGQHGSVPPEEIVPIVLGCLLIFVPLFVLLMLVSILFQFVYVAVWDYPNSAWEAFKASIRVALSHFLSLVGLMIMSWLISMGAMIVGVLCLCVGLLFTMPFFIVWMKITQILLYRSWTGQPLVRRPPETVSQAPPLIAPSFGVPPQVAPPFGLPPQAGPEGPLPPQGQ